MKHANLLRSFKGFIAGFVVLSLALLTNATSAVASTTNLITLMPVADAYVYQSTPTKNYGSASSFKTNSSPVMRSYLRFNVQGVTSSITKATLRTYAKTASTSGYKVYGVANNTWVETKVTYNSAPAIAANSTGYTGLINAGLWAEVDVTSLVQGNGLVSFALVGRDASKLDLASRESGATAPKLVIETAATDPSPALLWSADQESGDMTQWYYPDVKEGNFNGGGVYTSGVASAVTSTDFAHSGTRSAKLDITTPSSPTSGVRLFRWEESNSNNEAYYSAWIYIPEKYTPTQFWNIFQFKSKDTAGNDDPFWLLSVGNRATTGNMYLYLYYWQTGSGPTTNEVGPKSYDQAIVDLPVGKWVHIESYLKQASDYTGHVTVWQDGQMIFDKDGVKTKYAGGTNEWSINNYSNGFTTSNATIYVDDAAISKSFIP